MKSLILAISSIILSASKASQSVTDTELWRINYSAEVSPAMKIATNKAATMLGWMVDRPIPLDAPAPYNTGRAVLYVYAQSGMGWKIAETSVIGPIHVINGRSVPLRPTITINSDNWDALGDTFTWGDQGAVDVMFHELIHALGAWVCGTSAWTAWNAIADETHWWGEQGLASYRAEIDPSALFVPLNGWQHMGRHGKWQQRRHYQLRRLKPFSDHAEMLLSTAHQHRRGRSRHAMIRIFSFK